MELTSFWGGRRLFGPNTNTPPEDLFSIVQGIEYLAMDEFSMALGLSIDLIGRNTDATIAPLFSMAYSF